MMRPVLVRPVRVRFGHLALVGLGACAVLTPPTRVTVSHTPVGDHALHEEGEPLPIRRWQLTPAPSGLTHGVFVVKSELQWRTLWPTTPSEQIPLLPSDLDFSREMLLVAAPGDAEAAGIEVEDVIDTDELGLHVYVTESLPGLDCPAPETEHAVDLARVRRVDGKEVRFHLDAIRGDACGAPPKAYVACRENGTTLPFRDKLELAPGATVACLATNFISNRPLFDMTWSFAAQPSGTAAKIAVGAAGKGATFTTDVFGVYKVALDVTDDLSRTGTVMAEVDCQPAGDGLVLQMAWTKFRPGDDPASFPHVELHVRAQSADAPAIDWGSVTDCSLEATTPAPSWCSRKTVGATTLMTLDPTAAKSFAVALHYLDDRTDAQPVACVRAYRKGKMQAEACDPFVRKRGTWLDSATLDAASGRTVQSLAAERAAVETRDAAAPAVAGDAGVPKDASSDARH